MPGNIQSPGGDFHHGLSMKLLKWKSPNIVNQYQWVWVGVRNELADISGCCLVVGDGAKKKPRHCFFSELGQKATSNNGLEKEQPKAAFELRTTIFIFSSLLLQPTLVPYSAHTHILCCWWSLQQPTYNTAPPPPSEMSFLAWQCQSMDGCQIFFYKRLSRGFN